MSIDRKTLVAAVAAMLMAGHAVAADLSAAGGAVPAYFASEIVVADPAVGRQLTTNAAAALSWRINYNFSSNEVRYVRVGCSGNIRFDPATTAVLGGLGDEGAINGLGTNVLTFSLTSNGATNIVGTDTITLVGNHSITGTGSNVDCDVALYDQPSAAQAGGSVGRIANTRFAGTYLAFAPSYELVATASRHVADIDAAPSFSAFVVDANTTLSTASLGAGTIAFRVRDPDGAGGQASVFGIDGIQVALADVLGIASTVTVTGDYSIAANAAAPLYTGAALGRVTLNGANATALGASSATFNVGNTAFAAASLDLARRAGPIPAVDYVATLKAVSADASRYKASDISGVAFGSIVRNGTRLQAPLVTVPDGWISRLVLTNTGSVDRAYVIAVLGEDGNTIATRNRNGVVKAGKTLVIEDLRSVLVGFSGKPRATLDISVVAPTSQIQGLYQVVNPDSGSISNHVLVRPDSN